MKNIPQKSAETRTIPRHAERSLEELINSLKPEYCPPPDNPEMQMLEVLFDYAYLKMETFDALSSFCELALKHFSPKEIFGFLYWTKLYLAGNERIITMYILNNLKLRE